MSRWRRLHLDGFDGSMDLLLGREFGIHHLLLEGGANTNGAFFAAGLVDELSLIVARAVEGRVGFRASWNSVNRRAAKSSPVGLFICAMPSRLADVEAFAHAIPDRPAA